MVATLFTTAFCGIDVTEVEVQVKITGGLPAFTIVGLPDKAVAESRERVRAAIQSVGLALPAKKITVNLAPASLAKEGAHFDLPIALAVMSAIGVIPLDVLQDYYILGELSLDGRILPVSGILPAAIGASARGFGVICPRECGSEARWAGEDIDVIASPSLLALVNHIKGVQLLSPPSSKPIEDAVAPVDMKNIRGQYNARRALEIAAAGGHNMLMVGTPGTGKSMLASAIVGILPPMTAAEVLESSMIHSIAGELSGDSLSRRRPYRSPHHSSSMAAMVGGGRGAKPGEISLAHNGVLFLDELPEFARQVLESLRQPLETGEITVSRANAHFTYPARFQLIAAMNPCRCGYLGDADMECGRAPKCGADYQSKISGPFMDRIDIHVSMPMIDPSELLRKGEGEPSQKVAERVLEARERQYSRAEKEGLYISGGNSKGNMLAKINAYISGEELERLVCLDDDGMDLIETAMQKFKLSMRGYTRTLRVARTIADIEGSEEVKRSHIAEALSYRQLRISI